MKLYYCPGACSLSPHIALAESGLPHELVKVDLRTKQTEDGRDYRTINGKGSVPCLELDDGSLLTEGPAIAQYIADLVPEKQLAPATGTLPRYRLAEWLNFVSSEIHKQFSPLFSPASSDHAKAASRKNITARLDWAETKTPAEGYLLGKHFTVADGYLFWALSTIQHLGFDIKSWPNLQGFFGRVAARPHVQAALRAEGLAK